MAKKHQAWIHVGMPGAGDLVESALAHHHAALVELDVASLARSTAESFRAAVEMTRSHRDWALRRADVEGQWTRLVRRARASRCDLVFSQSLLAAADADQIALLVDALAGYEVHVVVTTGIDDESDTVARWRAACRKPDRLHVIATDSLEPAQLWTAFGRLVGFGTASLRLDDVPRASAALQTLPEALREIERLARRNASLEVRLEELDRGRRRLKKRLVA